jgi:hypothetical protein
MRLYNLLLPQLSNLAQLKWLMHSLGPISKIGATRRRKHVKHAILTGFLVNGVAVQHLKQQAVEDGVVQ